MMRTGVVALIVVLLPLSAGCEQDPTDTAERGFQERNNSALISAEAREPGAAQEKSTKLSKWARLGKRKKGPNLRAGRWRLSRPEVAESALTDEQRETIQKLEAIGYASGSQKASGKSGVTVLEMDSVYSGLNFYTSGHSPEATLMDMQGTLIHRWSSEFSKVFPDSPTGKDNENTQFWRRAHIYDNGDILAIFEGLGLVKLDKESNVLWANLCGAHHDLEVTPKGDIYVLTREARMIPRLNEKAPILEDSVSVLSAEGEMKKNVSLVECFENSERHRHIMLSPKVLMGDIFHTNTLRILDGRIADRDAAFREGNVLISLLTLDTIAVVDLDQKEVVWAHTGSFAKQHDPKILQNGNLLLFNNRASEGRSTVLEFDPVTKKTKWEYDPWPDAVFYSATCGTADRLPNGNTLITESDNGRAVEVTRDKDIVWEFYNPNRAGENDEYIATLFHVVRLETDFPTDWIE